MILYYKDTGLIWKILNNVVDLEIYLYHFDNEFKKNIAGIENVWGISSFNYRIVFGELITLTDVEVYEVSTYGKILTEEERLLNELIPSHEEVNKAKNTIEMIELIEVLL